MENDRGRNLLVLGHYRRQKPILFVWQDSRVNHRLTTEVLCLLRMLHPRWRRVRGRIESGSQRCCGVWNGGQSGKFYSSLRDVIMYGIQVTNETDFSFASVYKVKEARSTGRPSKRSCTLQSKTFASNNRTRLEVWRIEPANRILSRSNAGTTWETPEFYVPCTVWWRSVGSPAQKTFLLPPLSRNASEKGQSAGNSRPPRHLEAGYFAKLIKICKFVTISWAHSLFMPRCNTVHKLQLPPVQNPPESRRVVRAVNPHVLHLDVKRPTTTERFPIT